MTPILDFLGTAFNRVVGATQSENEQDKPNPATHKDDNDGIEELGIELTGSKRAGGNATGERAVKRPRRSGDAERLLPHHIQTPKDAKPIPVPSYGQAYDIEADWNPPPRKTTQASMAAGQRRGIQPQNTLTRNTPQSGKANRTSGFFKPYAKGQPSAQLQTQPSRGSNVTARPDFPDDFEQPQSRPAKKRKMSNGMHVDLTDDNDDMPLGHAVARQNKKQSASQASGSSHHGKPKKQDEPFKTREQSSVDQLLRPRRSLQDVRPADNGRISSDRASTRSSERARSVNSDKRSAIGTKGSPVQLDEDEEPNVKIQRSVAPAQLPPPRQRAGVPPINLELDEEEYVEKARRRIEKLHGGTGQGDRHDMNGINGVFQKQTPRRHLDAPVLPARTAEQPTDRITKSTTSHGRNGDRTRNIGEEADHRLADSFRRSDGSEKKPKQRKLIEQMQGTSGTKRVSLQSEDDELDGPPTVRGTKSRNASPDKPAPAGQRKQTTPEGVSMSQYYEPSSIKPTGFTRGGQPLSKITSELTSKPEEDDSDEIRVPISCILCKAFVSTEKGLELVWDEDLKAFVVVHQRLKVRILDGPLVKIGNQEVNSWSGSRECLIVWLRGPATDTSSGQIVIEFDDEEGLSVCYNAFRSLNESLKYNRVATDTLVRILTKQKVEMTEVHEKMKSKSTAARITQNGRFNYRPRQSFEEEQIVYEGDGEPQPRRPKARDRMQGASLAEVINHDSFQDSQQIHERDGEVSRHFDQPRRTTRQTKPAPVEERTPSPVRWTRVNNPKRWSHPVVYPDQGLRRVTVDFEDLERLDEGEFLNDNVVNFELRQIEENMAPEHKAKVHFFNTYFFSSMSHKNGKKDFNYEAVERWTKKTDLFNIPYVVVPINVELHWFVAIICNLPAIERKCGALDDLDEGLEEKPSETNGAEQPDAKESGAEPDAQVEANSSVRAADSPAGDVFDFGDDGKVAATQANDLDDAASDSRPSTAKSKKTKKKGPNLRKYDTRQPIIMSLDSFAIQRSAEIKYLKLYVSAEAKTKRGISLEPGTLQGMSAKGIPEQPNFCDCGVYLLGYVAEFAKDPDTFVKKVLTREMDRENDFASFDASAKRVEIREKLLNLQTEQDAERRAQKKAKAAAKAGQTPKTQNTSAAASGKSVAPASTIQKSGTQSNVKKAPPSMPRSSLCPPANGERSKKLARDNDSEELEVEPPSFVGKGKEDTSLGSSGVQTPAVQDDDDEAEDEMLMGQVESGGANRHLSKAATPRQQQHPPSDVYNRDLPIASGGRRSDLVSPLAGLEQWATNGETNGVQGDGPEIIDLGDEEHENATVEIPDSQEVSQPATKGSRRRMRF
ncbi:hypothetical protein M409DRAFT_18731 [Zasmidium cellare ATCC 36951]|uniref:Ubiquitin-like protease family profile domain-containing protein n=1 Tax=Zasmidium cellare ATCC 36951 TaxID=1080233 RepID=A0A6A6CX36_ZASCE|nr:uncharacterized protein M409DRAFT_18731 [Zasmidium cellare ATCC 36951]KAF2170760.1 hypothetical protein M409DRAFT_18731 [Zasmidium cellare ATCC 36951]